MAKTITFTHETSGGVEHEHELPAHFEVCSHCEGHGTHLHPDIRNHAYSPDEFYDSFYEEERGEYFRRGGRYDVQCELCRGERVISVIDEDAASRTLRGRRLLAIYNARIDRDAAYAAECAAERRMGA